jgi:two-component system nitrate/nitrite response regulator NarL
VRSNRILKESTIRVLVADNSRIHTRLLADALSRDSLLEAIAFEDDSSGLLAAAGEGVDVLVVSSTLDERASRGIEILHEFRVAQTKTRSVLLLGSSKDEDILKAFRAGARGIFSKNDPLEMLSECVRSVHQGKVWANNHALVVAIEALAGSPTARTDNASSMKLLSEREVQVVRYLAEGLTNREIAEQLKLSPHTIKNYLFRIFDKLGVSSRIELLFMTLSQTDALHPSMRSFHGGKDRETDSPNESALLEKSAEAGVPAAQLALAQTYFARRKDPQDLVNAYMWYLIAMERATSIRDLITNTMTPEQIQEAKKQAAIWNQDARHSWQKHKEFKSDEITDAAS